MRKKKIHEVIAAHTEIRQNSMKGFLKNEEARWTCIECGNIVSVHRDACLVCKTQYV